jgi:hypothetical protein
LWTSLAAPLWLFGCAVVAASLTFSFSFPRIPGIDLVVIRLFPSFNSHVNHFKQPFYFTSSDSPHLCCE